MASSAILEHVFQKSGSYEIPLRTMYAINSSPGAQRVGPQEVQLSPATAQFTSALIDHITKLPSQPCSLPVPFITRFLRKCFCEYLNLVDFPQALTGLDYLQDVETKRRRAIESAFAKLGLQRDHLDQEQIKSKGLVVAAWAKTVGDSERRVEALYTQLYIGLRRWILINELETTPFKKYNCVALLNALYPHACPIQPTTSLTPTVLRHQRDQWFKYIQAVEQDGVSVLERLSQQGKRSGDENGWPAVHNTLDSYLRVANSLIDDCNQVICPEDLGRRPSSSSKRSKADSGISFGSANHGHTSTTEDVQKRSAALTTLAAPPNVSPMWQFPRGFSKLERIAAELRKMKNSRQKAHNILDMSDGNKENVTVRPNAPLKRPADDSNVPKVTEQEIKRENRGGALRKLRSLGDLRSSASRSNLRSQSRELGMKPTVPDFFDVEEMRRKRMIWEANARREQAEKSDKPEDEEKLNMGQETVRNVLSEHHDAAPGALEDNNKGKAIIRTG